MSEIAIFGGTFDPPTRAHEAIVRACLDTPAIDEVWLMPSGDRTDKPYMQPAATRVALLGAMREDVFGEDPRVVLSEFELGLSQPTQTFATLEALKEGYPKDHFWFVFGADSYQDMPNWENGDELRRAVGHLVVPRDGYELPPVAENVRHLDIGAPCTSSTEVRQTIQGHGTVDHLVSQGVLRFIVDNQLYSEVQ